jgi:hypothetical protein
MPLIFVSNSWSDRPEEREPTRDYVDFDKEAGKVGHNTCIFYYNIKIYYGVTHKINCLHHGQNKITLSCVRKAKRDGRIPCSTPIHFKSVENIAKLCPKVRSSALVMR